jgi:hypothetical protein
MYAAFRSSDPDTASTILLFLPGLDGMDFLACVKGCRKLRHFRKSRTTVPELGPQPSKLHSIFTRLPTDDKIHRKTGNPWRHVCVLTDKKGLINDAQKMYKM